MKTQKIIYWTTTILFGAFMTLSAIPDILKVDEAVEIMTHLGYPVYFIPFIGVAKLLGAIAIVTPGYHRLKEWAYAGLTFDLIGAVYSAIAVDGFQLPMLGMLIFFTLVTVSYIYHHKLFVNKTV